MPDSWIDREELEELVGSFSKARKKRRVPSRPALIRPEKTGGPMPVEETLPQPEPADGIDPVAERAEGGGAGADPMEFLETELPPPNENPASGSPDLLESVSLPELPINAVEAEAAPLFEEPLPDFEDAGPVVEPFPGEEFNFNAHLSGDSPDFEAVLEVRDEPERQEAEVGNIFASDEFADESVIAGLWLEEPVVGIFAEETPPVEEVSAEEVSVEELFFEEATSGFRLDDFNDDWSAAADEVPDERGGMVVEIDESDGSEREFPEFLDDFETFAMPSPGVERESDRALAALRTARLRAEEGGLLRDWAIPSEVVEVKLADEVDPPETEIILTELGGEGDEGVADAGAPMVWDDVLPEELVEEPGEEFAPEESSGVGDDVGQLAVEPTAGEPFQQEDVESIDGTLADEIAACVEGAMRLEVIVAAVICDVDGFLLYRNPREDAGLPRETGILIDALRQADARLGMGGESVTQVSLDGTHWKCLLRAWEDDIELLAGLLVERPLESGEVQVWRQALSDTCRVIATKLL